MRKFNPDDASDIKEAELIKAEKWQLNALSLNPEYVWWGNFEDYMWKEKERGWEAPIEYKSFSEMFSLDELNECVNFYFGVSRKQCECATCEGTGLNPATKRIFDDWYDFNNTGRRWDKKITDHEVEALVQHGRLHDLMPGTWKRYFEEENCWKELDREKLDEQGKKGAWIVCEQPEFPTAQQVNDWASGRGMGHDAINKAICVEARAKREGVYGLCPICKGRGSVFVEPNAKLHLQLWIIHPRKGCSRGVFVEEIQENELPQVKEFLKGAANRNAERFSKL